MIIRSPPLQIGQQLWSLLGSGPGPSCERSHSVTDRQIHPFDKSGIEPSCEAHPLQGDLEICLCSKPHHMGHPHQLASPVAFFHLAIDQARRHLPPEHFPPSTYHFSPLSKMSGQGIKVEIQAITREERETARGQDVSQGVDDGMRSVLRSGAQMEHGKKLRTGVDDQPKPEHVVRAAQPGSEFVQLEVWKVEMAEEALVQGVRVFTRTGQPVSDGGLSKAEDPFSGRWVQSFGQR